MGEEVAHHIAGFMLLLAGFGVEVQGVSVYVYVYSS